MAKKMTQAQERKLQLIEHLIDVGWRSNFEWIESRQNREADLEQLIIGKLGNDCHLVSACGSYTLRIKSTYATFWQKEPKWLKLLNCPIKDIQMTEKGVQVGIVHIILEQ